MAVVMEEAAGAVAKVVVMAVRVAMAGLVVMRSNIGSRPDGGTSTPMDISHPHRRVNIATSLENESYRSYKDEAACHTWSHRGSEWVFGDGSADCSGTTNRLCLLRRIAIRRCRAMLLQSLAN